MKMKNEITDKLFIIEKYFLNLHNQQFNRL